MKRAIFLSVFIIAVIVTYGFAGNQSVIKDTMDLSGFTKVSFGVSGNLYINFGPAFKVELKGGKVVLDDIVTEVSGGRLVIKKENWRLNMNEKVTVYITMPYLAL